MRFGINLVYICLGLLLLPVLLIRRWRSGKYREGWREKLWGDVPPSGSDQTVWFHAVSVGEVNLLVPIVAAMREVWPDRRFVISVTSQTGYALAKQRFPDDLVSYGPLDFSWAVNRALRRWQPVLLVLVELELWPNLVLIAHQNAVKLAIVNGRLSQKSFRNYRLARRFFGSLLQRFDCVAVQQQAYAIRFRSLGAVTEKVHVTGSTKFDQARFDRHTPAIERLRRIAGIAVEGLVFLAGSTQAPEEQYALNAFRKLRDRWPQLTLILVPRHQERFEEVARMLENSGVPWLRRSTLDTSIGATSIKPTDLRVLLVDTIGELADWWGVADVGFVGGSFGTRGGQNMLEPAAFGVPVCFGPHTENFREISTGLVQANAAQVVHSAAELTQFIATCLEHAEVRQRMGQAAQAYVHSHQGAISTTCALLSQLLEDSEHPPRRLTDHRKPRVRKSTTVQ